MEPQRKINRQAADAGSGSRFCRRRLATVISRILDPFIVFSLTALLALFRSSLTADARLTFLLVLILVVIAPPFVLLAWALARKKVSDWDISDRSQRPLALSILLILALLDLYLVRAFGDPLLFGLFVIFFVWLAGFFLITLFWKISGHVGSYALFCALMWSWFGEGVWPLFLLLPPLAWARVVRKDHTLSQTAAGALYSFAVIYTASFLGHV